jgi:CheY-like chemotaxis protein
MRRSASTAAASPHPAGEETPPARVLVADDDEAVRAVLSTALQDEGFGVAVARDGSEALHAVRSAHDAVAVVLLDLMMPNASGWWFLEALGRAGVRRPRVVVVTALDPARVRLPVGVDAVVRKPFVLDHVIAAVRTALAAARRDRAAPRRRRAPGDDQPLDAR